MMAITTSKFDQRESTTRGHVCSLQFQSGPLVETANSKRTGRHEQHRLVLAQVGPSVFADIDDSGKDFLAVGASWSRVAGIEVTQREHLDSALEQSFDRRWTGEIVGPLLSLNQAAGDAGGRQTDRGQCSDHTFTRGNNGRLLFVAAMFEPL